MIRHDGRLVTVQVKKATVSEQASWGKEPRINACLHGCVPRAYKADPNYRKCIDFFAFVCPDLGSIWLVPESDVTTKQTWSRKVSEAASLDHYLF